MTLPISVQALFILRTLHQAGYQGYIVGGAVRDLLLIGINQGTDQPITTLPATTDYDFTTNATPEQILKLFPDSFYENNFGTVSITYHHVNEQLQLPAELSQLTGSETPFNKNRVIDQAQATKLHVSLQTEDSDNDTLSPAASKLPNYEITTFRSDGMYTDFRRPDSVTWGKTIQEDLDRRDFTINALALRVSEQVSETALSNPSHLTTPVITLQPSEYEVIDLHQGLIDLKAGLIRTVGTPTQRFQEDALRMLRAIRLSVQLNMRIDDATFTAIEDTAHLMTYVSGERVRDEFLKILKSPFPAEGVELLDQTGLLTYVLPELTVGKGVKQGGHHTTDVWTHSLDALRTCPSPDPIVRLATLLHDIGKPQTQNIMGNTITFYNHEHVGAKMARHIAYRLKLSKRDVNRITTLVRHHMFHYQPQNTDAAIRRFMRKVGLENIDDILDLREADRLGSGARKTSWRLEEMKQRMIEQLHQPMEIKDLAINGHDLMTEFNLKPGPILGEILHALFEVVLDNPELNSKEELLKRAKELVEKKS
ncbi:MAG TPA: HDIG domain-containing protein [Vitreimonas sp.]|nr:HDIG domain-containing protein [Vitreimonas sp.]